MKQTLSMARKELSSYFGSPMALIFVGAFLLVTLFTFFWVDTFFARGLADVRPMFKWMPILMIFLVAALTMRQWSEEQRSGTLEVLLTLPVSKVQLVLGKFLAVLTLVALALALTIFLPVTAALLGPLDWGPVIGGYLAALLMASAYIAIGLFVSSRTDNQLVALIVTVLIAGVLYLVGTRGVTEFVSGPLRELFRSLGAGSRFESIERGVIDLRDLIYYLSIAATFLVLNIVSIDRKRWSVGKATQGYRRGVVFTSGLLVANFLLMNFWLYPLNGLRLDLTAQKEYSLSQTTKDLLGGLSEPLTLRAFVSENTHPLLAPLAPQLSDLLREYEIAGRGKVTAEVVDPTTDPDLEVEANQTYGIQPSQFQVAGRYEASVINAYFDVLVRYGDQSEVLNFQDLIEVESMADGTVDVRFRNLEYDLTRAIKKTVYGFQSIDTVLASLSDPATLTLFVTQGTGPQGLAEGQATITKVGQELAGKSNGKLTFQVVDPDAQGAKVNRQQLLETYRLRPITASLFSQETYYFDMVLETGAGEKTERQLVTPAGEITEASVRTAIEASLKRTTSGFLKVIGLWTPPATPTTNMFGQQQPALRTWNELRQQLQRDYSVQTVDLSSGTVSSEIDVLLVVSPQNLDDRARYAIDQYLMRGGSVIVAAGNFNVAYDGMSGNLSLEPVQGGLREMLEHYGIKVEQSLVMDPQNEPFPVQTQRQVGGMTVQEYQAINYPFFVDVRSNSMDKKSPIVGQLPAVTLNWTSPVTLDEAKNAGRETNVLLQSSRGSWLRTSTDIQPNLQQYPEVGFPVEGDKAARPLAVSVRGTFESYFKGKTSPLLQNSAPAADAAQPTPTPAPQAGSTLESSPDSARLLVVGSADFLTDIVFQISNSLTPQRYTNSIKLVANAVDWSTEDLDLLTIRSRGTFARVLDPLSSVQQRTVEIGNYVLALVALLVIGVLWNVRRKNEKPMVLVSTPAGTPVGKGGAA